MSNASNFDYTDLGYDSNLNRIAGAGNELVPTYSGSELQSVASTERSGASESQPTPSTETSPITGTDLENLYISSWIKSRSYKPKSQGFLIDGKLGYIECMRLYVGTGGIVGGKLDIPDETTANSFHIDTAGLLWSGANVANKATAPIRINPTGEMTLGDPTGVHLQLSGPSVKIQSSDYATGVSGFLISPTLVEAENLIARGTIRGSVFAYDTINAIGGQLIVSNADTLASDMTALDASTLTIKGDTIFAVNDILVIRGVATSGIQEEWLRITNIASAPTYTVTRDLAGLYSADNNPVWKAGTPVVKQGSSDGVATYSGGWLRLLGEGTNSPYYSVYARNGIDYNNYTEVARLGNLNGYLGYSSDLYGIAIGETTKYLTYDPTGGLKLRGNFERNDFHWFTIFESLDGFANLRATLLHSGLTLQTNAANGDVGYLLKQPTYPPTDMTWDKNRIFRTKVYFGQNASQQVHIITGNRSSQHFGFRVDDSTLYATVNEGSNFEDAVLYSLGSISSGTAYELKAEHIVGTGINFYVDNVLKQTVSSGIPTGINTSTVPMEYWITTNENVAKSIIFSYFDFWQAN